MLGLGLVVSAWLALTPVAAEAPRNVLPVGGGNALTLPAQRHLVRLDMGPGSLAQPGRAGLWTKSAGVPFDNFELWSVPSSDAPADGGTP